MNILMMYMMLLSCVRAHAQVVYTVIKSTILSLSYIVIVDKNCQILRYRHMAMLEAERVDVV